MDKKKEIAEAIAPGQSNELAYVLSDDKEVSNNEH